MKKGKEKRNYISTVYRMLMLTWKSK